MDVEGRGRCARCGACPQGGLRRQLADPFRAHRVPTRARRRNGTTSPLARTAGGGGSGGSLRPRPRGRRVLPPPPISRWRVASASASGQPPLPFPRMQRARQNRRATRQAGFQR